MMSYKANNLVWLFFIVICFTVILSKHFYTHNLYSVPSVHDQNYTLDQQKIREQIDKKYCNGPCRFINFLSLVEQESKSQMHLRHLAFTAGLVNRTIVLPNVAGSRIAACLPYDFEYYYDIDWAKDNANHFNYITMQDFKNYLKERKSMGVPVIDQVLTVYNLQAHKGKAAPSQQKVKHCLQEYTNSQSEYDSVMTWDVNHPPRRREKLLVQFFKYGDIDRDSTYRMQDIELIHLRVFRSKAFSSVPQAKQVIPYSKDILQLADTTAKKLGNYTAIHWRMEMARHQNLLLPCAQHLVRILKGESLNQQKAFLLTDYPHTFTEEQQGLAAINNATRAQMSWLKSTSDTFSASEFSIQHHQAIQYLYKHHTFSLFDTSMHSHIHQSPLNWHLLTIPDSLKRMNHHFPGLEMIDSGWLGILDKLMAIRAQNFYRGYKDICGRGQSSFTAQIIAERMLESKAAAHYFGDTL